MDNHDELKGLGGWLILVGIGVVVGPSRLAYGYGPIYYSIFTDGTFEILTTAGTEAYHPLWGPFLIGEAICNSFIVLASVYLIYLFFTKHYLFPKVYIAIVAISLIFIPLDAWLGSFVLINEPMFDPATTKEFARTLVNAVIWVPYMLVSKRVALTFVEHMPTNSSNLTGAENAPPS
jgi:hypothetical protein